MKTIKRTIKRASRMLLMLWFVASLNGLTMNCDAPIYALAFVIANLITSALLCKIYVKSYK
jgi:hypothetical protein